MRRSGLAGGVSSTISNGGVSAREKIVSASALTSISPVARLGFLWPPRSATTPATPTQNSLRSSPAERVRLGAGAGLEHHLGEAAAIAQIDEHAAAVIAARVHPAEQDDALAGVAGAQRAAVMGSLQVGQELGHGGDFIRIARRIASRRRIVRIAIALAPDDRERLLLPWQNMRLRVLYHGNCFDGCSSAGVFTRFYRERIAKGPVEVVYRPLEHKGDAAAVPGRLLRRRRERVRRLSLLAGSAPDLVVRPPRVGVPAAGRRGPLPRRRHRPQVLRSDGEELHEVPRRHGRARSSASTRRRCAELIEWAEIIDGALFPDAKMAVELKEPALRLMTFIENNRDPALADRFIGDLVSRPLAEIAADPYVAEALRPLLAQHQRNIETIRAAAKLEGGVVFFDLADQEIGRLQQVHLLLPVPRGALLGGRDAVVAREDLGRPEPLVEGAAHARHQQDLRALRRRRPPGRRRHLDPARRAGARPRDRARDRRRAEQLSRTAQPRDRRLPKTGRGGRRSAQRRTGRRPRRRRVTGRGRLALGGGGCGAAGGATVRPRHGGCEAIEALAQLRGLAAQALDLVVQLADLLGGRVPASRSRIASSMRRRARPSSSAASAPRIAGDRLRRSEPRQRHGRLAAHAEVAVGEARLDELARRARDPGAARQLGQRRRRPRAARPRTRPGARRPG